MLFNSLEFLIFFPIVVAAYFAMNPRYRWILLLIASYYFYMCWNYKYIVLIMFSTVVDYFAGILMHKLEKKTPRKLLLMASLTTNLGLLFFFKYFNFFGDTVNFFFDQFNIFREVPAYHFLLPVGISFYTFQTLSYTIDIYRRKQEPEYHFGRFALFVSFFPQLVAGPIERSVNLLPQFRQDYKFEYERVKEGVFLMVWGFFKKVVIADRLAEYVNIVYNNPGDYGGFQNMIATFFFSFQIYCDFSGYSDIAIGAALILGYRLMTNFRRPYFAMSIREFWKRWHISLSTWFQDYVYISLGGNRVVKWRWYYNLFITFLVSGLWHGAEWTFVIWGALHGFYLVFAIMTKKFRDRFNKGIGLTKFNGLYKTSQILITFVLVYFSWIFFRANNTYDAFQIIGDTFRFTGSGQLNLFHFRVDFLLAFLGIGILLLVESLEEYTGLYARLKANLSRPVKWLVLSVLIIAIAILGVWQGSDFLYFQF
ncbi:MAG: membrane-bound O-acyltransferase family protein [Bacteroidetes bacterium]|nr:MAG: membrane-bound O-acyltransferase family protein [Bacteroidota bacterium]